MNTFLSQKRVASPLVALALFFAFAAGAFAANGQLNHSATEIQVVQGNVTVSGDIRAVDANGTVLKKFYDGRGTPTVVYFAQATTIQAEWGGSWVSAEETCPLDVAQRNNAVLQI